MRPCSGLVLVRSLSEYDFGRFSKKTFMLTVAPRRRRAPSDYLELQRCPTTHVWSLAFTIQPSPSVRAGRKSVDWTSRLPKGCIFAYEHTL